MAVYTGIISPTDINYTGDNAVIDNRSSGNGNFMNTTPTLLSGYIARVNDIITQLISTKNKMTALERLNVLEIQMILARKKGLF